MCFRSEAAPVSFTTKVNFFDEQGNQYVIPVSGTADNCLFTNFPFMQRHRGEYRIEERSNAPQLILPNSGADDEHGGGGGGGGGEEVNSETGSTNHATGQRH